MSNVSAVVGYILLGLVELLVSISPMIIALYKKNNNKMQIIKADAIVVLGLGIVGTIASVIFEYAKVNNEVWALIIIIAIEVIRLVVLVYLIIMAVKDKELPIF